MSGGEWFSAAELAELRLPGLPTTIVNVRELARRAGWLAGEEGWDWRKRAGHGGGVEVSARLLPDEAQAELRLRQAREVKAAPPVGARDERWEWFERQSGKKQQRARERLAALIAVEKLCGDGTPKVRAVDTVCERTGFCKASLYGWERRLECIPRHDWLPFLADGWSGSAGHAECPEELWDMLRADWLRPERPSFESCWRRVERVAKARGLTLPSKRTMARRIEQIPEAVQVAAREGTEALKRLYPAQERTRAHFHALEAVNADGHKWDVFVRWPDGEICRPLMIAFQDLFSGKILSWRVDKTENKEATRLAFGDLVEEFGIPDKGWLDNGRQFASKWITGGAPNRYRFKIRDDEPLGLLTQLGVEVHWTTPYSGQSKPIERAFRDFAGDIAKHPRFAGAYVGNNPMAKPENYGSKAVPLETFLATLAEAIVEHNARPGRNTAVCNGRSFDEAFYASYAEAPIRKASPAQRRLWLLAAESLRCAKETGEIVLEGNRFWADFLVEHRGQRVCCRFDPQALHDDLHVYAIDGRYLGAAPVIEAAGFDNAEAAREHQRARKAFMRGAKLQLAAEQKLTIEQVAAMSPAAAAPPPANSKVVRPVFGNTALKPRVDDLPEQDEAEIKFFKAVNASNAAFLRPRDPET